MNSRTEPRQARTVMVQGTSSNVGKSIVSLAEWARAHLRLDLIRAAMGL